MIDVHGEGVTGARTATAGRITSVGVTSVGVTSVGCAQACFKQLGELLIYPAIAG